MFENKFTDALQEKTLKNQALKYREEAQSISLHSVLYYSQLKPDNPNLTRYRWIFFAIHSRIYPQF